MSGLFDEAVPFQEPEPTCLDEALTYSAFWDNPETLSLFEDIYHYTTAGGLSSILQEDQIRLWFTRWDCVNDILEGEDVIDVYKETGDKLLNEKIIDEEYWTVLREVVPANCFPFDFCISNKDGNNCDASIWCPCSSYICCFSLDKDSLPMWNYYAKDGKCQGYNIDFFPSFLTQHYDTYAIEEKSQHGYHTNNGIELALHRVIYDNEEKEKRIRTALLRPYQFRHETPNAIQQIAERMKGCLRDWSLIFKKDCFKYENEARMILLLPDEYPKDAINYKRLQIKFRSKVGYLIPYVEVTFPKDAFRAVMIGPMENQDFAEKTLSVLLKSRDYGESISQSNIQFRPF